MLLDFFEELLHQNEKDFVYEAESIGFEEDHTLLEINEDDSQDGYILNDSELNNHILLGNEGEETIEPSIISEGEKEVNLPLSFTGNNEEEEKERHNEWCEKNASNAYENENWHLKQARNATERGDFAAAKDHRMRAEGWHTTGKNWESKKRR